jgi:radical SAM superfamily enzyme YgiQ (UPF0313 family)
MHGHIYRARSPGSVVNEFQYIADHFSGVKEVVIEDDTFTTDKKRVVEICSRLIERGLHKKLKWPCNARVDLELGTMKIMRKAGCRFVIPGIESGSQRILDSIRKGTRTGQFEEYIKNARRVGLLVRACYMVGNCGETEETVEKTLELALRLNTDTAQFFPLIRGGSNTQEPGARGGALGRFNCCTNNGGVADPRYNKFPIDRQVFRRKT